MLLRNVGGRPLSYVLCVDHTRHLRCGNQLWRKQVPPGTKFRASMPTIECSTGVVSCQPQQKAS
jgi:hypothetical protein